MNYSTVDLATRLMQDDPEGYEQYLLVALNHDEDMFTQASPHLCTEVKQGVKVTVNHFESVIHYGLYMALCLWRRKLQEAKQPFEPMLEGGIRTTLFMLANMPRAVVMEEQIEEYVNLWLTINQLVTKADALATVLPTWKTWLIGQKAKLSVKELSRIDGQAVLEHLTTLNRETEAIKSAGRERKFDTVDSFLGDDDDSANCERFPMNTTTWKYLNESLGGGFGRGEHALFVALSGGGKTVMACQIAAEMAFAGRNVLLISTEEGFDSLLPRIVSASSYNTITQIPYQQVKRKPKFHLYLPSKQLQMANKIRDRLRGHLFFSNWTGTKDDKAELKTYSVDDLVDEVEAANKQLAARGERLDVVILDWLGATLKGGETDPGRVRLIYETAADKMQQIATVYDVATISFAQASDSAVKKTHIGSSDIANCKSLHHKAYVAVGISHVADTRTAESSSSSKAYKDIQCFNVFKTRGGVPMAFWMRENFDYMRYDLPTLGF
jgi:hypothetical protein